MGADLYVEKTGRYFRDSYNATNIWWVIGLSYWEVLRELEDKKLIDDGIVTPTGVEYICKELKHRELTDELVEKHIDANFDMFEKPVDRDEWRGYFRKKYSDMRDFWDEASSKKSGVVFSV